MEKHVPDENNHVDDSYNLTSIAIDIIPGTHEDFKKRYILGPLINTSLFGGVYQGFDKYHNKMVAIKISELALIRNKISIAGKYSSLMCFCWYDFELHIYLY